jgi:hypothetical protein
LYYVIYLNFEDIFDETGLAKETIYQASLNRLFDHGLELTIENKKINFKPFEKSGGMSKNKQLSFLNEDLIEKVRIRIMMGIDLQKVDKLGNPITFPLSKLFYPHYWYKFFVNREKFLNNISNRHNILVNLVRNNYVVV